MIMVSSPSSFRRAALLLAFVLAAGVVSTTAQAAVYPVSGNARFQIGNGIPLPIGFTPPPNGKIGAKAGAVVLQTPGPDPKQMTIPPGQLSAPRTPVVHGVFLLGPPLQVQTSIGFSFPGPGLGGVFKVGGRTGAATVTFCAGQVVTPTGNPACTGPGAPGNVVNGLMRYTKTAAQFGGPAQNAVSGTANIAIFTATAPCTGCLAVFAQVNPAPASAKGAPFGFFNVLPASTPSPSGLAIVNANANGTIAAVISPSLGPGIPDSGTSFGGPWTTGMLTVSVTANLGPSPEIFIFSGMDSRVSGVGNISLVSGAIGTRSLSGPNAHRGWLNLTVGAPAVPAVSPPGLAAAVGLLLLSSVYALRRRRSPARSGGRGSGVRAEG